jgi:hypothetical protein
VVLFGLWHQASILVFGFLPLLTMKLSVVMPVYNERQTLRMMVERVLGVPLDIELLCV